MRSIVNALYFFKNFFYNIYKKKEKDVKSMLTEKEITEICQNICATVGYDFTIPVKINKRLTRTLGRVSWIRTNGVVKSTLMEFSYQLLNTATLDSIKDVIAHECAHYLVIEETKESHGHDMIFKAMCKRINCTNDGTICHSLTRTSPDTEIYKYTVVCNDCKKIVGHYHRAGKIVQHPDWYSCKCGGSLSVTKNF